MPSVPVCCGRRIYHARMRITGALIRIKDTRSIIPNVLGSSTRISISFLSERTELRYATGNLRQPHLQIDRGCSGTRHKKGQSKPFLDGRQ